MVLRALHTTNAEYAIRGRGELIIHEYLGIVRLKGIFNAQRHVLIEFTKIIYKQLKINQH